MKKKYIVGWRDTNFPEFVNESIVTHTTKEEASRVKTKMQSLGFTKVYVKKRNRCGGITLP